MSTARITWQETLLVPAVRSLNVWDFEAGDVEPTRRTGRLPVRFGRHTVGDIPLPHIFAPKLYADRR